MLMLEHMHVGKCILALAFTEREARDRDIYIYTYITVSEENKKHAMERTASTNYANY